MFAVNKKERKRYYVENFYPWKDIVGKKVSKLRSIAELRVFYAIYLILM
jgi:hypothetical protein